MDVTQISRYMSEDADAGEGADAAEETNAGEAQEEPELIGELRERLDAVEAALEAAETEADLDDVEADLEGVELPEEDDEEEEGDEDDEDDGPSPVEELEDRIGDLRDGIEDARGPYGEDVVDAISGARSTLTGTRWTEDGIPEVEAAVSAFLETVGGTLDASFEIDGDAESDASEGSDGVLAAALRSVEEAVEDAELDADDDAETIASLLEAVEELEAGLEDAEEWSDLETRDQLSAEGYYNVLGHYKDYPVEWSALKEHEQRGNVDMVLLALNSLQSDFMEEHCLEALERMGRIAATDEAIEEMLGLANRRNHDAIRILGKMRAEGAVDTLVEYVDPDNDAKLQKVTLQALGEIGSQEAVQPIANHLAAGEADVRPVAARALGLIGDTRAIEPLSETLETDDDDTTRAAAAWALRQIATREALEVAAEYDDERSFLLQTEAEKAQATLGEEPQPTA